MDVCIRLTFNQNCLDEINDLVRQIRRKESLKKLIIETDKKLKLNYFKNGIDKTVGEYKKDLMVAIYGVFSRNESKKACEDSHFD